MSKESKETPGNAMASQAAFTQAMIRTGQTLMSADRTFERMDDEDVIITHINVTMPGISRADYLVVVKALMKGQKVIGFHDAPTYREAIEGVLARLNNGSMKFKEDKPYERG